MKDVLPLFSSALEASVAAIDSVGSAVSSLKIVPLAVAVVIEPPVALESVTVSPSSVSRVVSPLTLTVITWLVSPAAKFTVPLGRTLPSKSVLLAKLVPLPVTAYCTLLASVVEPLRVTVKVKGVLPLLPSNLDASVAAIARVVAPVTSSSWIVPAAVAVVIDPPVALDKVTVKPSSGSTLVSPLTLTVITWLVSPAAKSTVPLGRTLPAKSVSSAELVPLPVTAY